MRAVTTATAATVLGIDRRSLDNLLLQLGPLALPPGRQGVERRIPVSLLDTLALTTALIDRTGMRIRDAFGLASGLVSSPEKAASATIAVTIGPFLRLEADVQSLKQETAERLELAIETVVRRPRGRPRQQPRRVSG